MLIEQNAVTLRTKRLQRETPDEYGIVDPEPWEQEKMRFVAHVIARQRPDGLHPYVQQAALDWIEDRLDDDSSGPEVLAAATRSDGVAFERECLEALRELGWQAARIGGTGDQGADIIAEKRGVRVVVQCKHYGSSVGNAAIQQAHAAMAHYGAHGAAVVSNAPFTPQAYALARSTKVMLLRHLALGDLAQFVEGRHDDYP